MCYYKLKELVAILSPDWEAIGIDEIIFRRFLGSNSPEALPYKGLFFDKIMAKGEKGRPGKAIPVRVAIAFWIK